MIRYLLLQLLALWLIPVHSQELTIKSFTELPNDMAASIYGRKDLNGEFCALIKVKLTTDGAQFSPYVVEDVDYKEKEYWVYLPTMSKHMEVKHPNFLPLDVVFADYGVKLKPKTTYSLVLSIPDESTLASSSTYGSVSIEVLPDESEVYIDEKKVGTTPLFLQNVLVGKHKLEVKKNGFETLSENIIVEGGQTYSIENKELVQFSFTVNGVSFDMIKIEAGTFMMGATTEMENPSDWEKPVHQVTLTNNYYLGKYEVTQALWEAVMGSNPSEFKGSNLPVERVSWDDCQLFVGKLNNITGKNFRLPTEAEWEYAARGGKKSRGYQYSGSNNLSNVAWYEDNSNDRTHPVGTKQPNELGIYDMSGNVWEWCQDWENRYSSLAQTNPKGPENAETGPYREVRGGSFFNYAWHCRSSSRTFDSPGYYNYSRLGFRLCLSE